MQLFCQNGIRSLHNIAQGRSRGNAEQQMNMIIHAANLHGNDAMLAADAAEVTPDILLNFGLQPTIPVLGGEHDMVMQ